MRPPVVLLRGLALLAALAVLGGCAVTRPELLSALEADPMASWLPDGARLVLKDSTKAQEGSSGHSRRQAVLLRRLALPDAAGVGPAQRDGVRTATAAGWALESENFRGVQLTRPLPTETASLFIGPALDDPAGLIVELRTG